MSGRFTKASDLNVNNIARYNLISQQWYPLGDDSIFIQATNLNVLTVADSNVYTVAGEYVIMTSSFIIIS